MRLENKGKKNIYEQKRKKKESCARKLKFPVLREAGGEGKGGGPLKERVKVSRSHEAM